MKKIIQLFSIFLISGLLFSGLAQAEDKTTKKDVKKNCCTSQKTKTSCEKLEYKCKAAKKECTKKAKTNAEKKECETINKECNSRVKAECEKNEEKEENKKKVTNNDLSPILEYIERLVRSRFLFNL
jgi:hypothetical protein